MTWDLGPADLAGVDLVWLLDLSIHGRVHRYARRTEVVTDIEGDTYPYRGGLDWGEVVTVDGEPGTNDGEPLQVAMTVFPGPELSAVELDLDGFGADSMTGVLKLWPRGSTKQIVVIDGVLRGVAYDEAEDAITFDLEQIEEHEAALWPPSNAVVSTANWPNPGGKAKGERYPTSFGVPGSNTNEVFASAGLLVETGGANDYVLLSDGRIDAGNVRVRNDDDGTEDNVAVTVTTDGGGRTVSVADINGSTVTVGADDKYFWRTTTATAGGMLRRGGTGTLRGAGQHIRWWMERSSLAYDRASLEAIIPRADAFLIDTSAVPSRQERIPPWEWVSGILELLPVSTRPGPSGVEFTWWDFWATPETALLDMSEARGDFVRVGAIERSDRDDVRNEFRLSYRYDAVDDRPSQTYVLTGDDLVLGSETGAVPNIYCRRSFARYGRIEPWEFETELVADSGTAGRICAWRSAAFASQFVEVVVDVPHRHCIIEPGRTVLVTSSDAKWTERMAFVRRVDWTSRGSLEATLRMYDDPARDH